LPSEDERRDLTRKAAGAGLVTVTAVEVGALMWSVVYGGYRNGTLSARDQLFFVLISCAIIVQAGVVWVIVGRGPAANPTRAATRCLLVALAFSLLALMNVTPHVTKALFAIVTLSVSLAGMSLGILIATGIARLFFVLYDGGR
jgi:hydrogenase-4 membrane subunit HyfE